MIILANESLFFFPFSNRPSLTGRQKGYPSKSSPHLIWLMHLFEIWMLFSNHDNYRWNEEWQGSKPDVFITVVSDHRRHGCVGSAKTRGEGLTVYKSVCLKVNRSEEVPRPRDPQVRLDNSIYSLCPWQRHHWQMERENKRAGCTPDDLKGIYSMRITAWLNVGSIVWAFMMNKCLCYVNGFLILLKI